MNIQKLLLPTKHGFVGEFKHKSNYRVIVLSGGGIDSYMSTHMLLRLISAEVEADLDEDDYTVELIFMTVNYGQQTFNAEFTMTMKQVQEFNKIAGVSASQITMQDGLMELIRNPLADRKTEQESAMLEARNYASNDDYVPNRNARFLFNAAGYADSIKNVDFIVLGAVGNVNQDNSLVFLEAAYQTIKQSSRDCFPALYAPFVLMSKSVVALAAQELGKLHNLLEVTTSCFDSTEVNDDLAFLHVEQCGVCRSCTSLKQAFKFAGVEDPYYYMTGPRKPKVLLSKKVKSKFKDREAKEANEN